MFANWKPWLVLGMATVAVGVAAGLAGMTLGLLLRFVQHLACGYNLDAHGNRESFLVGVSASSPLRRILALCLCGIIAATGWWTLYRYGKPLVSISEAVRDTKEKMPFLSTCIHTVLQITTVALGSPLGREVAPRELSAVVSSWLVERIPIQEEHRQILIACGAGAGLAAVYNVPLSGALFTLEVLLGTLSLSAFIPALVTSVLADLVASLGLGNAIQYSLPTLSVSPAFLVWAAVTGPLFGLSAYLFARAAGMARRQAPKDWQLVIRCVGLFPMIGLLAIAVPELLGNGKGIAQLSFADGLSPGLAALLLFLRLLVILAALYAGAAGGLLTPGLSLGALLGVLIGSWSSHICPGVPLGAFALVGGAAFLATSMRMPLTAIVIIFELTHARSNLLIPILLSVAGSVSVLYLYSRQDPPRRDSAKNGKGCMGSGSQGHLPPLVANEHIPS